ncbi:MAG: AAA family ATPase [Leptospiraceae bacterium]|nr:AAA family ATPase [Leptospiraceae bacterium]
MVIRERILKILQGLNEGIFEKEEIIQLSLLSALAGESIFLLGLPGVAKSLIARRLKFAFKNAQSFEYLMNRFSTPDEIFGPVSVLELQKDNYKRITDNYLPDSHIVFLDEIWKAGPSIQNTLLTVLNEKIFQNGKEVQNVPLRGLIAASNELPAEDEGQEALWDRFLIRYVVNGIQNVDNFKKMVSDDLNPSIDNISNEIKITEKDYNKWDNEIKNIKIPDEVYNVIDAIRKKIQAYNHNLSENQKEIYISDRRWKKIIRILRTSAFINGRNEIDLMDCFLIQHCLWSEENELEITKDIVANSIREFGYIYDVNINDVEREINTFKLEVEKETNIKIPKEKVVNKVYHKKYYKLVGMQSAPQYCLISIDEYKKLTQSQVTLKIYDINGQAFSNMTVYKKDNSIMVADHSWSTCHLETATETIYENQKRKPSNKLVKVFDEDAQKLNKLIKEQIESIESYLSKKSESLESNIFINQEYSKIIYEKLNRKIADFKNLILEVEKIKAEYDGIE